jgi:hypothetical protein
MLIVKLDPYTFAIKCLSNLFMDNVMICNIEKHGLENNTKRLIRNFIFISLF